MGRRGARVRGSRLGGTFGMVVKRVVERMGGPTRGVVTARIRIFLLAAILGCATDRGTADVVTTSSPAPGVCPATSRIPERVRFGLVGFWGTKAQQEAFEPVARYLSARVGRPVDLLAASRYDELADWIAGGTVDIALVPPLAYVKAKDRLPCLRLLRTMVVAGTVHYSGYIVVRAASPITRARDLAGRRVAFVEPSSASGYLFAKRWLEREGIDLDHHGTETAFLGSHDAVIRAVLSGEADAGATFQGALQRARQMELDTASLRILAITGRIPLDALVAAPDLDPEWVTGLDAALDGLNTSNPEGRSALSRLVDITGWARSDDRLYDEVREVLTRAGGTAGGAP